jgi:hypothetical protein
MNKLFILLLAPPALFSQVTIAPNTIAIRPLVAAPAVEFTSTSNASQAGVSLVLGYQFTVRTPVILTSLGAILHGSSTSPVFGALPASMPVGLWDEDQNLLISATVSASDPAMGHFNYRQVAKTLLVPGVGYTIAGLVPPGLSVLSDVPGVTPGSEIVLDGPRSFASKTLAFPETDAIGLRKNYFGASFTYTGAREPVALSGPDRNVVAGAVVKLDGSASFSETHSLLSWGWTLVSKPAGSKTELFEADSPAPSFTPDLAGVYIARLVISDSSDASVRSQPSTVSIAASPSKTPGAK